MSGIIPDPALKSRLSMSGWTHTTDAMDDENGMSSTTLRFNVHGLMNEIGGMHRQSVVNFIHAIGDNDETLGMHRHRGSFRLDIHNCPVKPDPLLGQADAEAVASPAVSGNVNNYDAYYDHISFSSLMLICNVLLFGSSWSLPMMVGFLNTVLISFLLSAQTVCVWLIVISSSDFAFLAPTDFTIGMAMGISIGGYILAFVVMSTFGRAATCDFSTTDSATTSKSNHTLSDPVYESVCIDNKGSMNHVWFWSGLIFWLDLACRIRPAISR